MKQLECPFFLKHPMQARVNINMQKDSLKTENVENNKL